MKTVKDVESGSEIAIVGDIVALVSAFQTGEKVCAGTSYFSNLKIIGGVSACIKDAESAYATGNDLLTLLRAASPDVQAVVADVETLYTDFVNL